jgi:Gram-negative bacterial TonB protein C-terminal
MRPGALLLLVFLFCCGTARARKRQPPPARPSQFEIGRRTFVDFGPPFDFYEIFIVRPSPGGTSVEKITLTPAADGCFVPAKLEFASGSISEPVATLFGTMNPCEIPEKALRHELKRRKKGLVFSGADVVMQIQCGGKTRLIRSGILDRDMFDPAPKTPEYTSWTMQLMKKLDRVTGPGVWDKRIFPILGGNKPVLGEAKADPPTLQELSEGKFDVLFAGDHDEPSDLFRASQKPPAIPTVRLLKSAPVNPTVFVSPAYPPLAKMARIEGLVTFRIKIGPDGDATDLAFENGNPVLRFAVKKSIASWRFRKADSNQQVEMTIDFMLNCPSRAVRPTNH